MNYISTYYSALKREGRKALIGYITAGFPTKNGFQNTVSRLQTAGLDMIEIGVPFSDPVADGLTIQRASQKALENGVTLDWILRSLSTLREIRIPIILMTYTNPILAMGIEPFFKRARESFVNGVIIPDLIPEEGAIFEQAAVKHGLSIIYLAAPTSPLERLKRIAQATDGFVYAVSIAGITGARAALPAGVIAFMSRLRRITKKPIALGFGISTPEHIRALRKHVDGVIVGSALINHLEKSLSSAEAFVASLQKSLNPNRSKGV